MPTSPSESNPTSAASRASDRRGRRGGVEDIRRILHAPPGWRVSTAAVGFVVWAAMAADAFLAAVENLSRFHRDHERFYAQAPREAAVVLQRHARALGALASRWSVVAVERIDVLNPYEGAEDLNVGEALQLDGILFMEGEEEPVELTRLKRDLRTMADDAIETGSWLASAMEATWEAATALLAYPELADLLGDRHRIIVNDWQAASMSSLAGRLLHRAVDVLDRAEVSPEALRADLVGARTTPRLVHSAVELIDRAADLLSDSAGLVHDNERRWRVFRERVVSLTESAGRRPSGTA
jgi:hypothetical protein